MKKSRNAFYLLVLFLFCCRKPYNPPAIASPGSYLVVEGVINTGSDSTIISLSKTVSLNAATTVNPVMGATVTIQSNQNNSWPLIGDGKGNYASAALNLSAALQYRLLITTGSSSYASDFVSATSTPPIDSVGYIIENGGVQLYVNTHDPTNNTKYYRWDYGETWQFHAEYYAGFIADSISKSIVPRTQNEQIYFCFAHDTSSNIILKSTANLSKDVVYQTPLTNIQLSSEKLESEYSILVKQYALSADAYQFYYFLKQNTEQLGSIFDAEPSQINGNIHNTANPNEPVIGYVTVTNVQSKRIFISNNALPNTLTIYPYVCSQDTILQQELQAIIAAPNSYPNQTIIITTETPTGKYLAADQQCADCTFRGTTQTPPFWK